MVHFNGTSFENGTYAGGYVSHVGQLFFDQSLISAVSEVSPYSTNTQSTTLNSADSILSEEVANGHDPFVEYSLLSTSDDVSEGIFGWISFGVDLSHQETLTGASTLTSNGGVANENSGIGGGSGGPEGSGPGGNSTLGGGIGGNGTIGSGSGGPPSGMPPGSMPLGATGAAGPGVGNGTLPTGNATSVVGGANTNLAGSASSTATVSSSTLAAGAGVSGHASNGLIFLLAMFGLM